MNAAFSAAHTHAALPVSDTMACNTYVDTDLVVEAPVFVEETEVELPHAATASPSASMPTAVLPPKADNRPLFPLIFVLPILFKSFLPKEPARDHHAKEYHHSCGMDQTKRAWEVHETSYMFGSTLDASQISPAVQVRQAVATKGKEFWSGDTEGPSSERNSLYL